MAKLQFKKATKEKARARLAIAGPAGSGKTYTALSIGECLGSRIALIDSERGSASKYSDRFSFDCLDLPTFSPTTYMEAIKAAEDGGYEVLIIDSLSHLWAGNQGILQMVDDASKKSGGGFNGWKEVTPIYNEVLDTILRSPCHIICTLRAKQDYVVVKDDRGRNVPQKVGLAPIIRDQSEYEFDIYGMMLDGNELMIMKSRMSDLSGKIISKPGKDVGEAIKAWLTEGADVPKLTTLEDIFAAITDIEECKRVGRELSVDPRYNKDRVAKVFAARRAQLVAAQNEVAS